MKIASTQPSSFYSSGISHTMKMTLGMEISRRGVSMGTASIKVAKDYTFGAPYKVVHTRDSKHCCGWMY